MRKYLITYLFFSIFTFSNSTNQNGTLSFPQIPCAYDHVIDQISEKNSFYKTAVDLTYEEALRRVQYVGSREIYTMPVVFHVVYNNGDQNISDDIIYAQLQRMNEDFRRMNENAAETRPEFLPFAADAMIEFVLATEDPGGNPTNGITHTYTDRTGFPYIDFWDILTGEISLDDVKQSSEGGVDAWDTSRYLNIWICNIEESFLGQVLGFAYPPINMDIVLDNLDEDSQPDWSVMEGQIPDESLQGVVVHYTTVGPGNPTSGDDGFTQNDLGRTVIHEVGHYLGLRHIWGDAQLTDGCSVDDGISDTPNQNAASSFNCNYSINSCSDSPVDYPDMVENYMDYSSDACMNMFSNNQAAVMRAVLEFARPGLIEWEFENCLSGDVNDDEELNVLDVVLVVGIALNQDYQSCADINVDNTINVLDIVLLVNFILDI